MDQREEIKSKIDIVELVQGYIPLKQSGRNFKACCPFHSEKSPSFMVSAEKQIWHCFGCNEGGDIFGFVMKMEGLDFFSSLKLLADKAGVKLPDSPKSFTKDNDLKNKLFAMSEIASKFYQKKLFEKDGEKALSYLKERGITEKTIKEFKLGFAPRAGLVSELKQIGFKEDEAIKAGLAKDRDGNVMDYFWERILFPIADHSGSVVGFSARTLKDEIQPKYLNTPDTEIYHKSRILYGLDRAKADIRKMDHVILVEGNMDVIASHMAGIKNTIATSGTALTQDQLRIIKRFTNNLKLAFDVDAAGSEATSRAIKMAQEMGFNIKIIEIPEGKDPADVVKKDKKIGLSACKNAKYVVDYIFDKCLNKYEKDTVLGKRAIARELLAVIKELPDKIEQDHYLKKLSKELEVDKKLLQEALSKKVSSKIGQKQAIKEEKKSSKKDIGAVLEEHLVVLSLLYPQYRSYVLRNIDNDFIRDIFLNKIFSELKKAKGKKLSLNDKEDNQKLDILELKIESEFQNFSKENIGEEIFFCVKRLKDLRQKEEREKLAKELTQTKDKGEIKDALERLDKIIKSQKN